MGSATVLFVVLLSFAGFRLASALTGDVVATVTGTLSTPTTPTTPATTRVGSTSTPSTSPSGTVSVPPIVVRATGEYARAPGGTNRQGSGTLRTYRVEVEAGTEQDASAFASAVDATLAHPGSWTAKGKWSLQRVSTDSADFAIRLATPTTVDKVCAGVGLDTNGYVSCRAGKFVMINRDRWLKAVPHFGGDISLYRRYVVNHEVGHQLGYSHLGCPGRGKLAPVMQQQTFGLDGCRPNGTPYVDGVLVTGPPAP